MFLWLLSVSGWMKLWPMWWDKSTDSMDMCLDHCGVYLSSDKRPRFASFAVGWYGRYEHVANIVVFKKYKPAENCQTTVRYVNRKLTQKLFLTSFTPEKVNKINFKLTQKSHTSLCLFIFVFVCFLYLFVLFSAEVTQFPRIHLFYLISCPFTLFSSDY